MGRLLDVDSVSVRFWRGYVAMQVLDDLSFELETGELGGIWGDRSAGKTTLTRVVAGTLSPDAGRVTLAGQPLDDDSRRRLKGRVHFQVGLASRTPPKIPDLPVREWIATSLLPLCSWREARARASMALNDVGAADTSASTWARLSDTERSLVSLAYGLARRPALLVVDDPLAGLGALRRAEVMQLLRRVADDGTGVLVTAAELSDFKGVDRIWSLTDGRLLGPPARPGAEVVELRPSADAARGR